MKSRFLIEFETDVKKIILDGDDFTEELENEMHRAFDRTIHNAFSSPDAEFMEDLPEDIECNFDDSLWPVDEKQWPKGFELPGFSVSLREESAITSEIKEARKEEIKKCIKDFRMADINGFSKFGSMGASALFDNAMGYFDDRLKELKGEGKR